PYTRSSLAIPLPPIERKRTEAHPLPRRSLRLPDPAAAFWLVDPLHAAVDRRIKAAAMMGMRERVITRVPALELVAIELRRAAFNDDGREDRFRMPVRKRDAPALLNGGKARTGQIEHRYVIILSVAPDARTENRRRRRNRGGKSRAAIDGFRPRHVRKERAA